MIKTNVMRILEQNKIEYKAHEFDKNKFTDAKSVADLINRKEDEIFKTLVTHFEREYFVFIVPSNKELNLKKAAKAVDRKNIEMLKQKDLQKLTGYVHGGCSPIGMKKQFETFIDESAKKLETFVISAGKIGFQIELSPTDLSKLIDAKFADITMSKE